MFLYPEGGFPNVLRQINDDYAKKHNLPVLKHTILPRAGAMKAVFEELLPPSGERYLDYVVDITMAHRSVLHYMLFTIGIRRPVTSAFRFKVFKIDDVRIFTQLCCTGRTFNDNDSNIFQGAKRRTQSPSLVD